MNHKTIPLRRHRMRLPPMKALGNSDGVDFLSGKRKNVDNHISILSVTILGIIDLDPKKIRFNDEEADLEVKLIFMPYLSMNI